MPLKKLVDSGQPIAPLPDVQRTTFGIDALSRFDAVLDELAATRSHEKKASRRVLCARGAAMARGRPVMVRRLG